MEVPSSCIRKLSSQPITPVCSSTIQYKPFTHSQNYPISFISHLVTFFLTLLHIFKHAVQVESNCKCANWERQSACNCGTLQVGVKTHVNEISDD